MWIVGLLPPDGSSSVPESVRDAFPCFSNIRNPGSYTAPDESWLLHHMFSHQALSSLISQSDGTSEKRRY